MWDILVDLVVLMGSAGLDPFVNLAVFLFLHHMTNSVDFANIAVCTDLAEWHIRQILHLLWYYRLGSIDILSIHI